jgi:hypothetical protein
LRGPLAVPKLSAMGTAGVLLVAWSLVPLVLMTAATAAAPYLKDRG